MRTPAPLNVGEGPQLLPLRHWGLNISLDGELAGAKRLDELGEPRWVEVAVPCDSEVQLLHPTLNAPYYTFVVEAASESAAWEVASGVLSHL